MFGMGFMEIMLIAIIAVIALGPEKLPTAMIDIAKIFKKFKSGIEDAKETLHNEINLNEMKDEANKFKAHLSYTKDYISSHDDDTRQKKEIKIAKKTKNKKQKNNNQS